MRWRIIRVSKTAKQLCAWRFECMLAAQQYHYIAHHLTDFWAFCEQRGRWRTSPWYGRHGRLYYAGDMWSMYNQHGLRTRSLYVVKHMYILSPAGALGTMLTVYHLDIKSLMQLCNPLHEGRRLLHLAIFQTLHIMHFLVCAIIMRPWPCIAYNSMTTYAACLGGAQRVCVGASWYIYCGLMVM